MELGTIAKDVLLVLAGGAVSIATALVLQGVTVRRRRSVLGRLVLADIAGHLGRKGSPLLPKGVQESELLQRIRRATGDLPCQRANVAPFDRTVFSSVSGSFDAVHPEAVEPILAFYHYMSMVEAAEIEGQASVEELSVFFIRAMEAGGAAAKHMMRDSRRARGLLKLRDEQEASLKDWREKLRSVDSKSLDDGAEGSQKP